MRCLLVMCLVVFFSTGAVFAGDDDTEKKISLWEVIRTKIEKVTPQKKPSVTTAVGGVRGSKAETGKELYWKGEDTEPVVDSMELDSFKEALTEVEIGNHVQARVLFEKFVTDYPGSSLKDDALSALHELAEEHASLAEDVPAEQVTAQPVEQLAKQAMDQPTEQPTAE